MCEEKCFEQAASAWVKIEFSLPGIIMQLNGGSLQVTLFS